MKETTLVLPSKCPACKFTIADLKKINRLGCSKCYEVYKPIVLELLPAMHRDVKHRGKTPKGLFATMKLEADIQQVKDALEDAIQSESYYEAAKFRDTIKEMESALAGLKSQA